MRIGEVRDTADQGLKLLNGALAQRSNEALPFKRRPAAGHASRDQELKGDQKKKMKMKMKMKRKQEKEGCIKESSKLLSSYLLCEFPFFFQLSFPFPVTF